MRRTIQFALKRALDILLSGIGLLLLSPLLLLIIVVVRATSPGPAIFRQKRIGRNGKEFEILKFRTMVVGAEHIGDGRSIKTEADPRITRVGRILRKTSLDELPQLVNVLLGSMSLIGPRPPLTYFPYPGFSGYPSWAKRRFEMRPGITGLAQVRLRNSSSWDERIKIDLIYLEQFSLLLDLKIAVGTIAAILKKEHIYAGNSSGK